MENTGAFTKSTVLNVPGETRDDLSRPPPKVGNSTPPVLACRSWCVSHIARLSKFRVSNLSYPGMCMIIDHGATSRPNQRQILLELSLYQPITKGSM